MKWEYQTLTFDLTTWFSLSTCHLDGDKFNSHLNEYGAQGWELVNVFEVENKNGTAQVVAVLKRPKQEG